MKDNEYQCAMCNGVFEKGWSDEEAQLEKQMLFGSIPMEQCAIICDDCFQTINPLTVSPIILEE